MPGTTANFGWAKPVSSDPIAQGADTIGQGLDGIDAQFFVPVDKFTANEPYASWPLGTSVMRVASAATAAAGNWPVTTVGGTVITTRLTGMGFQTYYAASGTVQTFFRWYGVTPSAWISIIPGPTNVPQDSITADAPSSSWPNGLSAMAVSAAGSTAGNWPSPGSGGMVTTYRGAGIAYQTYIFGGSPPQIVTRWYGSTPGPWLTLYGTGIPSAQASGLVSNAPITANTLTAVPVTFPAGRFTAAPRVLATLGGAGAPQNYAPLRVDTVTATGFNLNAFSATATSVSFNWLAIQGVG